MAAIAFDLLEEGVHILAKTDKLLARGDRIIGYHLDNLADRHVSDVGIVMRVKHDTHRTESHDTLECS